MDYVPNQRDQRYRWYNNLSQNSVAEAAKVGAPAASGAALKQAADDAIAKMDATDTSQEATNAARLLERQTETVSLKTIRETLKNWKTLPGWAASGSESTLSVTGTASSFDASTYKTKLKVSLVPGGVRVDFVKKGVSAVNIYMRIRGQAGWTKIGMDTEPPYTDSTPLAQPGVPEVREYMARGILHDEEIGQDSDVVSITYAG